MAVVSDSKIAEEHTLNRIGVKSESFSVGYPPKPSCNGQIQRWEFPKVAWNQNSSICAVFYRHLGWVFPDLARTPQSFAIKLYTGKELWYCGTELCTRTLLSVVRQHKKKAAKKQITKCVNWRIEAFYSKHIIVYARFRIPNTDCRYSDNFSINVSPHLALPTCQSLISRPEKAISK